MIVGLAKHAGLDSYGERYLTGSVSSTEGIQVRAAVLLHEEDIAHVQDLVVRGQPPKLEPTLFPITAGLEIELVICSALRDELEFRSPHGHPISRQTVVGSFNVLILVHHDNSRNCRKIYEFAFDFLHAAEDRLIINPSLIVLNTSREEESDLDTLPRDRVFFVPKRRAGAGKGQRPLPFDSDTSDPSWVRASKSLIEVLIASIAENQTPNPNVGFGLLLVDAKGHFFVRRRMREPGYETLGTVGGNFTRGMSITDQLSDTLQRRFSPANRPQVELGPLLACTNMRNGFYHYIDLTFLAIVSSGNFENVSDADLRPVSAETQKVLPKGQRRARSRFTFDEMTEFYNRGMLFRPVANAFESLCRQAAAMRLVPSSSSPVVMPPLMGGGALLQIPLSGVDIIAIASKLVAAASGEQSRSVTALPFFEGEIE